MTSQLDTQALADWQPIETAPNACHMLVTYFDHDWGEWVVGVHMRPFDNQPWTHWLSLPASPAALSPIPEPAKQEPVAWQSLSPLGGKPDRLMCLHSDKEAADAYAAENGGHVIPLYTHPASAPQCCMCGKKDLSTVESDGGAECQLNDGRWTCSAECYYRAVPDIDEVASAPSAPVAEVEAVGIKPLNWVKRSGVPGVWDAESVLGYYRLDDAFQVPANEGMRLVLPSWRSPFHNVAVQCVSIDEAKAAAQADYDARIRSALTLPPHGVREAALEVEKP